MSPCYDPLGRATVTDTVDNNTERGFDLLPGIRKPSETRVVQ